MKPLPRCAWRWLFGAPPHPGTVQSSGCSQKGRGLLWCTEEMFLRSLGPSSQIHVHPCCHSTPCLSPSRVHGCAAALTELSGPQSGLASDYSPWHSEHHCQMKPGILQEAVWLGLQGKAPSPVVAIRSPKPRRSLQLTMMHQGKDMHTRGGDSPIIRLSNDGS